MSRPTTVLLDQHAGIGYYLGFDLLLARAPLRAGRLITEESAVAYPSAEPPESPARLAAIRLVLLERGFSGEQWRSVLEDAEADGLREATDAGLDAPPALGGTVIAELDIG